MKTISFPQAQRKHLLIKCLILSFLLHIGALTFFYFNPLVAYGNLSSLFGISATTPKILDAEDLAASKKNHIIEEAFKQIIVLSPHLQQPFDFIELPKGMALAPNHELANFEISSPIEKMERPNNEIPLNSSSSIAEIEEKTVPALFAHPESKTLFASQLQIDALPILEEIPLFSIPLPEQKYDQDVLSVSDSELSANYESEYALNLSSQMISPSSLKVSEDLKLKTEDKAFSALVTKQQLSLDKEQVRPMLFVPKTSSAPIEKKAVSITESISDLEQYDFPPMATAAEWNDDFDAQVTFLPHPEGKGYIFSIALTPNFDISSHSLKQNLYFILDRSDSVQKHRFAVFKRGVLKALSNMQQGDTFNIFVIDKKVTRFNSTNIPVTLKNIQAAEEFLDKQEGGGLFSAGEIYPSLVKILDFVPSNDEIHTAILLTDGKSNLSTERKQSALKKWVEANSGKLALYTAAIGRDNDLLSLDLLSSVSGGKLLYSDTHASFPRKLAKLILDLKDPVAKDLLISTIPQNPQSQIEFYPVNSHLPSLFSHQPYTLVGQIDQPCAFDLVIQGRHRDQWIAIKKNISFIDGHKGNQALTKQWTAQRANLYYAKFMKEGKAAYLKDAQEILKKSRFEVALE